MSEKVKQYLDEATTNMDGAISFLEKEMHKVRAGKASPAMLEGLKVDYYGTPTPIENVANISTPDPHQLVVQPWEKTMLSTIEKAIVIANLGLTPRHEGDVLRIQVPIPTEERRRDLVKRAKAECENAKVNVRNVRRNILEKIKKLKDDAVSEDIIKSAEKSLQDLTDKYIKDVDSLLSVKEKEIMEI